MGKQNLKEVQEAANQRRFGNWQGGKIPKSDGNHELGLKLCHNPNHPREGRDTVSFALLRKDDENIAYYASQDGADVKKPAGLTIEWDWINILDGKKSPTGLHAEMTLIRHLFKEGILAKGEEAERANDIDLVIVCQNACVCADCSGWMRAHGILHCPPVASGPCAQWVSPRTGAYYYGGKNISFYSKHYPDDIGYLGGLPSARGGTISRID